MIEFNKVEQNLVTKMKIRMNLMKKDVQKDKIETQNV